MKEIDKILSKAKVGIMFMHDSHFIQQIMYSLVWRYDEKLPTAGTNGLEVIINPNFFMNLSENQRIGLLAHEIWHVAFQHMLRVGDKDKGVYNQAADHVINLILLEANYELPPNGLHDPKYKGWDTEMVYADLMKNPKGKMGEGDYEKQVDLIVPDEEGGTGTQGKAGNDKGDKEGPSKQEIEEKITDILVKARISSKLNDPNAGSLPGGLDIMLDELINPQLPWNVILQNYLTAKVQEDSSFAKPNRRYMPDMYMPTLTGEGLNHVVIAMDSSGSVSDNELSFDWAEIRAIKERLNPQKLTIINFDHGIRNEYIFTRDQQIQNFKLQGRGGTSLDEPIAKIKEYNPDIAIVFSDLYCEPSQVVNKPLCDVIWVCIGNPTARVNYGRIIHASI